MATDAYSDGIFAHQKLVMQALQLMIHDLIDRGINHDNSKFGPEERTIYEQVLPEFTHAPYGTPAYEAVKAKLGPALAHHYLVNDHHPEYFEQGIAQMDLIQLCEMVADWYAASSRGSRADLLENLEKLKEKYAIEPQLFAIISHTMIWLSNHGAR